MRPAATRPSVRPTTDPNPPHGWRVLLPPKPPAAPGSAQTDSTPEGVPSSLVAQADGIARKMCQIRKRDKLLAREYGAVWGSMLDAALNKTAAKQWIGRRYGYRPTTVETYIRLDTVWDDCVRHWQGRGVEWGGMAVQTFMEPSRAKRGSAPTETQDGGEAPGGSAVQKPSPPSALTPVGRQVLLLTALVHQHVGVEYDEGKLRRTLPKLPQEKFAALVRDVKDWVRAAGKL